jgi:hypothetical protein
MEGEPLDQFCRSSRGKVFPRRLLRGPHPILRGGLLPKPHLPSRARRTKTAISLRSLGAPALEPPQAPTYSCRPGTDQSSGAAHPRIRRLRNGGLSADGLVWTDRFVSRGAAPRAVKGTQVSALPATRDPAPDSALPGARRRARFHSLNVPFLIGDESGVGGLLAGGLATGICQA